MDCRLVTAASVLNVVLVGSISIVAADDAAGNGNTGSPVEIMSRDTGAEPAPDFLDALTDDRCDDFRIGQECDSESAQGFEIHNGIEIRRSDVSLQSISEDFRRRIDLLGLKQCELDTERTNEPLISPTGDLPVPFDVEVPPFACATDFRIELVYPRSEDDERPAGRLLALGDIVVSR